MEKTAEFETLGSVVLGMFWGVYTHDLQRLGFLKLATTEPNSLIAAAADHRFLDGNGLAARYQIEILRSQLSQELQDKVLRAIEERRSCHPSAAVLLLSP